MSKKKHRKPNHDNYYDGNTEYLEEFNEVSNDPVSQLLNQISIRTKCKGENQKKLVKHIREKEVTICSGLAGTGKAQPLDALVLTPSGYKKMGDLKLNDLVITDTGENSKIINIYPQGEIDIYKLTFSDGTTTEASGDHLWLTQTALDRNYRKFNRINGKKVYYGDRGRPGSIKTTKEISDSLIYNNHTNHSIPITKPIQFQTNELLIDPYVMGVLLGDGGITTNIALTTEDDEILNEVKIRLTENYRFTPNGKYTYKIVTDRGADNPLLIELDNLKLRGKKSINKFIPHIYKYSDINQRIELLQGLLDTDGTIDKRTGSITYYSVSEQLINDVRYLIESLGGISKISTKQGSYKKNGVKINCNIYYVLSITLPNEIQPFKLQRKLQYVKPKTKYLPKRFIIDVEYIGKKDAQCILIDSDSHLYLTNNCIITHNTFLSCSEALRLLKNYKKYEKIIIVKSVTTLRNEEIGFLKGDMRDKMEPFMYSFIHNFEKLIGKFNVAKLRAWGLIEELPIAYMRGINLDNAIIIIDEAQNISIDNIRTILTRLGTDSKMIFLGDEYQIDMKHKDQSSLRFIMEKFQDLDEVGIVTLTEDDVVRNPLIRKMEKIFHENN